MDTQQLIAGIDEEIARLKQVRALLAGHGVGVGNGQPRKRRVLSAEARARIVAAQKRRWAKQKQSNGR